MHGLLFNQLLKFIEEMRGAKNLQKIRNDAGVGNKFYSPTQFYPDNELEEIISSACKVLKVRRNDLLESFGTFITPVLLNIYQTFIPDEWDAMDTLENAENTIHKAVRLNDARATPPRLKIVREGPDDISITYSSKRNMINLGIGIIRAIGLRHNTRFEIKKILRETDVMLKIKRLKRTV